MVKYVSPPHIKVPQPHGEVPALHNGMCNVPNAGNLTLISCHKWKQLEDGLFDMDMIKSGLGIIST